ncbi:alpha/beta hydrolase [Nocardioides speluncae]|uniref:alpha/beta hydrolase n=1 Tax=Nocardioides speluncae TaxID=2670337 RepID=UPI000D696653|nr:alpha/beta hydrolase [Nocardioides speluncae]
MTRHLVFVHGRAQQGKNATRLKGEWLDALDEGLAASGLTLPISREDTHFPFYGDTLDQLTRGIPADRAAEVIVRGDADPAEEAFLSAVVEEMRTAYGVTDDAIREQLDAETIERGPRNWEWVLATLRALDKHVPSASAPSIALFTKDVHQYLTGSVVRRTIDGGVATAFPAGDEVVVVAHSLGTVVAYRLLTAQGKREGWQVPALVTLGSPHGVTAIRRVLAGEGVLRTPECVGSWFNAYDPKDVVALRPLTPEWFPLKPAKPAVVNHGDIDNQHSSHHGIEGYLGDPRTARAIYDALTG